MRLSFFRIFDSVLLMLVYVWAEEGEGSTELRVRVEENGAVG